jgi:hypothetical protein
MTFKTSKILGIISLSIIPIGIIFSIIGWFFINSSILRWSLFGNFKLFLIYFGLLIFSLIFGILSIKKNKIWQGILGIIISLIYAFIAVVASLSKVMFFH